jgi:hypothetical protein
MDDKHEVLSSQLDDRSELSDLLKGYRTSTSPDTLPHSATVAPRSAPKDRQVNFRHFSGRRQAPRNKVELVRNQQSLAEPNVIICGSP